MPYIRKEFRELLEAGIAPDSVGELNFAITHIIDQYLVNTGLSYTKINDVVGVLECSKFEFCRRILFPYEDKKMSENGDVYSDKNLTKT